MHRGSPLRVWLTGFSVIAEICRLSNFTTVNHGNPFSGILSYVMRFETDILGTRGRLITEEILHPIGYGAYSL